MDRSTEKSPWKPSFRRRLAVAALIGECESVLGKGLLTPPAEEAMRVVVAEVLSAFAMQHHDERNAA